NIPWCRLWICRFMDQFTSWEISSKQNKWQGRNITRWRSEEFDRVWKAAETEMDPVKRASLFVKMNDLVIQNIVVIPVAFRPKVTTAGESRLALSRLRSSPRLREACHEEAGCGDHTSGARCVAFPGGPRAGQCRLLDRCCSGARRLRGPQSNSQRRD